MRKFYKFAIAPLAVAGLGLAIMADATVAQAGEEVFIGGALSLTGIQAPLDEPTLRGAKVAVKALNDAGGILGMKVKFVNLDGKSDPTTVANVAVQLISEGADMIIAPCDFDFGGPASREAQSAGLVGISTCASAPAYGSKALGDKQFTASMWNTTMGAAAAEWGLQEKGWKTAYVVTDTFLEYTVTLSQYFIEHLKNLGGKVLNEDKYTQGDQDFSAQLARIQNLSEKPDVIFISSYMPDLGTIIKSIREVGITTPIMGGDSYDDPSLFAALGKAYGNNVWFITHSYMKEGAAPGMGEFLAKYQEVYGEPPDTAFVAMGWDTVMIMATAAESAGSIDGAAMAKAMETVTFDLLSGKLKYTDAADGHDPRKEAALVELQGGKTTFLGWIKPENPPAP